VITPHVGYSGTRTAPAVANGFVTAGLEKCWSQFDKDELHDVFIVISEGADGEHIARTFFAADLDDARQTHHDNYANEPLVAVHQ
jgi:hypothetical protein